MQSPLSIWLMSVVFWLGQVIHLLLLALLHWDLVGDAHHVLCYIVGVRPPQQIVQALLVVEKVDVRDFVGLGLFWLNWAREVVVRAG